MASLHRQSGRPYYFCAYIDQNGKRHFVSTKMTDLKQAKAFCATMERSVREAKRGLLTPERARDVIARGVADVFAATHSEALPESKLGVWLTRWLEMKKVEASAGTLVRYEDIVANFRAFMGTKCEQDIASVSATSITKWRDTEAQRLARSTVNLSLKTIRSCFKDAMRQGLVTINPAVQVDTLKVRGQEGKRPFTTAEISTLLEKADEAWKGMILFGLYTGQRLGDIATLTWRQIDVEKQQVTFVTQKTGRRLRLHLAKRLAEYIASLPSTDDLDAPLFPDQASLYRRKGNLSGQFHDLLVEAGLASIRSHLKEKHGRDGKRSQSKISFHSLRHTAVTMLKAAGVSDALAREIVGHESAAVNRVYTHLNNDDIAKALKKLPYV